jgi:hypothetical protein
MPFASPDERAIHFQKHGHEFGAANEVEYEQMADAFMVRAMNITMRECTRPNNTDRVRLDISNDHFGVAIVQSTTVKTFYIVPFFKIHRRGGKLPFFAYECARTDL